MSLDIIDHAVMPYKPYLLHFCTCSLTLVFKILNYNMNKQGILIIIY
jgi:hypothetical protein